MKLNLSLLLICFFSFFSNEMTANLNNPEKAITSQERSNLEIRGPEDLNLALHSFRITGDDKILIKILEVINENEKTLIIAYAMCPDCLPSPPPFEFDFKDFVEEIAHQLKQNPEFKQQMKLVATSIYVLESLKKEDSRFVQQLNNIYKKQPSLDYQKKIHRFNEKYAALQTSPKIIAPEELPNFVIQNSQDLNLVLDSFKITGEEKFLIKALEAINENEEALLLAYEANKRIYMKIYTPEYKFNDDDIKEEIKNQLQHNPQFANQMALALMGLNALQLLTEQNPHVGRQLYEIFKKQPNLNYLKKIQSSLNAH